MTEAELVARHYTQDACFEFESIRLTELCPVEFAVTKRQLGRWIPRGAHVAEIGVGVGHYSEHLASRGCRIYLVDVAQRLLDAAIARLREAGLTAQLTGAERRSATDLQSLPSAAFDAVLMLGPLYHLRRPPERERAVGEAARLLKPAGLLFAAGINRLSYLRDHFRQWPHEVVKRRAFHEQYLREGNLDPDHAPPIGFAHLTTPKEFRSTFAGRFEELALVGVESFTTPWQEILHKLTAEEAEEWLDLVERTGVSTEGLGVSDHFLFVGRKAQPEFLPLP